MTSTGPLFPGREAELAELDALLARPGGAPDGLAGQHAAFQGAQFGPRFQAELGDQPFPGRPVHGQRVGRAARAVQGRHQQRVQAFAQRVFPYQGGESVDRRGLVPAGQFGFVQGLVRREPALAQPVRPVVQQRYLQAGERHPAPQLQRLAQQHRRLTGFPGADPQGLGDQGLEAVRVQLPGRHPQPVAVDAEGQPVGVAEEGAQPVDVQLEAGRGAFVGPFPPQRVGERVRRDAAARPGQQHPEQRAPQPAGHRLAGLPAPDFHRSEHRETHGAVHGCLHGRFPLAPRLPRGAAGEGLCCHRARPAMKAGGKRCAHSCSW
ncbi:hypothetical protein MTQ13_20090 [Streptomyces sp. XM4011]|nr:hypothetical protein [Streptomyces sp. XM4011]MCK1816553.1 hypothetical protein [Streptomyces sp. XM4011]